jgi:hypothetical protein
MTPLEQLYAQRQTIEAQIATIVAKGANATPTDLALLRAYRRGLMSVNAQIVILEQTPEDTEDVPF